MAHSKKSEGRPAKRSAAPASATSAGNSTGSKLRAFYVDLASNLDKFSAFVADPAAVAKREGLSKEEMDLLFSGDQGKIYASLRPEMAFTPPQPQQSTERAGAATQAAPAPVPPSPRGYPCASPWPMPYPGAPGEFTRWGGMPYPYGYAWPSYGPASSPYVQTTSPRPAKQPEEVKPHV